MDFRISEDIELVLELLDLPKKDLAAHLGISVMTLDRWIKGISTPRPEALARFYDFAYARKISLNRIKAQLYQEEIERQSNMLLFHGSKAGIDGALSATRSRKNNDFGQGFYCGQSLEQAAMFVTAFPSSSLYLLSFDPHHLSACTFNVDQEWVIAIANFRGRLGEYAHHPLVRGIRERVSRADYVIAPIADNRMYAVIDRFIDGEITDLQCQHSLSATDLGRQYVLKTDRALAQATMLEHCFLGAQERRRYERQRHESNAIGLSKAKAARRQYRNQGRYIEEVLA